MFTKQERENAKRLTETKEYMELLEKILFPTDHELIRKMPIDTPDAQFGQNMKACIIADGMIRSRFQQLYNIVVKDEGDAPVAPE